MFHIPAYRRKGSDKRGTWERFTGLLSTWLSAAASVIVIAPGALGEAMGVQHSNTPVEGVDLIWSTVAGSPGENHKA